MLAETDPELRAMAQDEVARLEPLLTQYEEELKVLMLPKDPNDEKNVVLEIRAGTGGDEATLFADEIFRMYGALRRIARLEGRSNLRKRFGRGRSEGSHRPDQRQAGLQPDEV